MKISVMALGPIQANCYIVWDETTNRCAVIDPGADGHLVAQYLQKQNLSLAMIFLTHGHYDHIEGVQALRGERDVPVYVHKKELELPLVMTHSPLFYTCHYEEGDAIEMDGITFRVLHTPGHSAGSVCLLAEEVLFTGDTLFRANCGRTDFPQGSYRQMLDSLARLARLEGNLTVLSGHGEASNLDFERRFNPYMREALAQ